MLSRNDYFYFAGSLAGICSTSIVYSLFTIFLNPFILALIESFIAIIAFTCFLILISPKNNTDQDKPLKIIPRSK